MKNLKVENIENKFTIQNVPIKCNELFYKQLERNNLQYKMFLLNKGN